MGRKKKTAEEYRREIKDRPLEALGKYDGVHVKIKHRCKICQYEWLTTPRTILHGSRCPKCIGNILKTHEEYLGEIEDLPIETLDTYVTAKTKIWHRCKVCQYKWLVAPYSILRGNGCPKCAGNAAKTTEEYKEEIKDFPLEVLGTYKNNHTKILHRCGVCHYEWKIKPSHVLKGHGCPHCASYGFNPNKPATLYYLSVHHGMAYKIGITNRTVEERFSNKDFENITILEEWYFEDGKEAQQKERDILEEFKWARFTGDNLLESGNTELFMVDILNKDKGE